MKLKRTPYSIPEFLKPAGSGTTTYQIIHNLGTKNVYCDLWGSGTSGVKGSKIWDTYYHTSGYTGWAGAEIKYPTTPNSMTVDVSYLSGSSNIYISGYVWSLD